MASVDLGEFFKDKCASFSSTPCNSSDDYEIMESINREMDSVRREFQAKAESSSRMCANFRFSRC